MRPLPAAHAGNGAASVPGAADGFDAPAFERQAKLNFIRLQAASDSGNLEDIRQFTTPEVFAELSLSLANVSRASTGPMYSSSMRKWWTYPKSMRNTWSRCASADAPRRARRRGKPVYGALAPDEAGQRERWLAGGRIAAARLRQAAAEAEMLSSSFVALLNHLLTRAEWARRRLSPFAGHPRG